ncbi:MAG TPA: VWA domain-containing protein [Vicinamibacterales bacterium]|nr:VWA domain-containing protein [Vicinamibacterales bacterium]
MRSIATLVAIAAAAGISVLHAQGNGQKPSTSGPTFKSSTRLVQVSVVVQDGRRRPVTDLKPEDFEIFEDGKPQPVSVFALRGQAPSDAVAEGTGVFTNRLQSPTGGGVVAIVFDRLNTSFTEQTQAREHIVKYLGQVRPEDRVALFLLDENGMSILHDFSKDAGSLLRAMTRAQSTQSSTLAGAQLPPFADQMEANLDAFARGNLANMNSFYQRILAYTTIEALEDVAAYLQGFPGRKNLIWVSSGFPFGITNFGPGGTSDITLMSPETRRATRALNHADVSVYPVDARGLVGAFSTHPSARVQEFSTIYSVQGPIDGLRHVADWTGGRAFYNTNDLGSAINGAVKDSDLTYVLGYYPENQKWDDRFRQIKVKVKRGGLEVRHRSGYFAVPPDAPDNDTRQKAIVAALDSPLETTSLPITVTVEPAGNGRVTLAIQLDRSAPSLVKENGLWVGSVDVAISQTLPSGKNAREADVTLPFSLSDEMRDRLLKEGLRLTRTVQLNPDAHQLRVVVRDVATGTTGSVIITASQIDRRDRQKTTGPERGTVTR